MRFTPLLVAAMASGVLAGCPSGYRPLQLQVTIGEGASRMNDYKVGLDAVKQLIPKILCRQNSMSNVHRVRISAKNLNVNNPPTTTVGGSASTPACSSYLRSAETYSIDMESIRLPEQGRIWSVMMHEVGHTMATRHVGDGFMVSGSIPRYQFIDRAVRDSFNCIGIKFIEEVDRVLARGGTVPTPDLLAKFTPYTYSGLQGLCSDGCGTVLGSTPSTPSTRPPATTPSTRPPASNPPASGGCRAVPGFSHWDGWCKQTGCYMTLYCTTSGSSNVVSEPGSSCIEHEVLEKDSDSFASVASLYMSTKEAVMAQNPEAALNAATQTFDVGTKLKVCKGEELATSAATQASGVLVAGLAIFTAALR